MTQPITPLVLVSDAALTGKESAFVSWVTIEDQHVRMRPEVGEALTCLAVAARTDGFILGIASAYRAYDTQLRIWNEKVEGVRPVLDDFSQPLVVADLTSEALLFKLLRWSAIPGASRHHWGTDVDVYDRATLPPGTRPALVPSEYEAGGAFAGFGRWLDERAESFGFYRPYGTDRGRVHPEPWHLSYRETARAMEAAYGFETFAAVIGNPELGLREEIGAAARRIYAEYVRNGVP